MPRQVAALLLLVLLTGACSGGASGRPAGSPSPNPSPSPAATPSLSPSPAATPAPARASLALRPAETLASGLEAPWALDFAPDGAIWLTERPGRVRVIRDGRLLPAPALTLSVVAGPGVESGLLGIAIRAPYAYLYYTTRTGAGVVNRISRFSISGDSLAGEQVLVDGIPGGSCCHFGGRLRFGPDGYLYAGVGDGQVPARAADPASLNGKVIRLRLDGSPPEVFALGLRNPQGLAFDPENTLWVTDHGPTGEFGLCCHDEVDQVRQGGNYGWPAYAGNTRTGAAGAPDPQPPVVESGNDTWAPSGASFYSPAAGERPALVWAGLRGKSIYRLLDGRVQVVYSGPARLRLAEAGPDRCLYVLTSDRDGRGSPQPGDDRLLRLCNA